MSVPLATLGGVGESRADGYFTAAETSRIARIPLSTLNFWARTGVIVPSQRTARPRLYSFQDLRDLRVAHELRGQGARRGEIKAVLEFLRSLPGSSSQRLAHAQLQVVGARVSYRNPELDIDPVEPSTGGQRVLAVPMAELDGEVRDGDLRPAERIAISPDVRGGTPVVAGTRVPAQLVAELVDDGVPRGEILDMYPSLSAADLDAAARWQRDVG